MWAAAIAVVLFVIVVAVVVAALGSRSSTGRDQISVRAKPLLTEHESAFFRRLQVIFAEYNVCICPQVAMGALLRSSAQGTGKGGYRATRNRFAAKIVDFVLCEPDGTVLVIVELDDSSHRGKESADMERDQMLTSAGYRVARIAPGWKQLTDPQLLDKLQPAQPTTR